MKKKRVLGLEVGEIGDLITDKISGVNDGARHLWGTQNNQVDTEKVERAFR